MAAIQRELQAREIFLLILTPESWASEWVQEELNLAFVTHRQIVPVLHKETPGVGGFLLGRQWVRVVGLSGAEAAQQVLRAMAQSISTTTTPVVASVAPAPTLLLLGPAPAPSDATSAHHLTPMSLYNLGFRGYSVGGVECILPPLCPVPGGLFIMGSDKSKDSQADDNETPQYPIEVGSFAIGQHPVTVAEYACARTAQAVREPPKNSRGADWQGQLQRLDHPVVCISWWDALTYVLWLAKTTGQPWHLPSEAEWEKAARWDLATRTARIYPWGENFDKTRCNTREGGKGGTTPIGSYPNGASPCVAQDMASNVCQWTSSLFMPYPYRKNDGRENLDSTERRVSRGCAHCEPLPCLAERRPRPWRHPPRVGVSWFIAAARLPADLRGSVLVEHTLEHPTSLCAIMVDISDGVVVVAWHLGNHTIIPTVAMLVRIPVEVHEVPGLVDMRDGVALPAPSECRRHDVITLALALDPYQLAIGVCHGLTSKAAESRQLGERVWWSVELTASSIHQHRACRLVRCGQLASGVYVCCLLCYTPCGYA